MYVLITTWLQHVKNVDRKSNMTSSISHFFLNCQEEIDVDISYLGDSKHWWKIHKDKYRLTDKEFLAIYRYTEEYYLNKEIHEHIDRPDVKIFAKILNSGLSKIGKNHIRIPSLRAVVDFEPPKEWYNPSFRSTTIAHPKNFVNYKDVGVNIIEIRVPRVGNIGGNIMYLSQHDIEMEFLLKSGSKLRAVDLHIDKYGQNVIWYEWDNNIMESMGRLDLKSSLNKYTLDDADDLFDNFNVRDLNITNQFGRTALMYALYNKNSYRIINGILSTLDDVSEEINKLTDDGDNLVTLAIKVKNVRLVKDLIEVCDVAVKDGFGRNLKFLINVHLPELSSMVDVKEIKDNFGRTSLFYTKEPNDMSTDGSVDYQGNIALLYRSYINSYHDYEVYNNSKFKLSKDILATPNKYGDTPIDYMVHWVAKDYGLNMVKDRYGVTPEMYHNSYDEVDMPDVCLFGKPFSHYSTKDEWISYKHLNNINLSKFKKAINDGDDYKLKYLLHKYEYIPESAMEHAIKASNYKALEIIVRDVRSKPNILLKNLVLSRNIKALDILLGYEHVDPTINCQNLIRYAFVNDDLELANTLNKYNEFKLDRNIRDIINYHVIMYK
jgi:hypothetical protein